MTDLIMTDLILTDLTPGPRITATHRVTDADTAVALGSGALPVLATPRLLAWLEGACVAALPGAAGPVDGTPPGTKSGTSVGTRVVLEHTRATPVGAAVHIQAELVHVEGRLLRFTVAAHDDGGRILANGELTRVVVESGRFIARVSGRG